MAEWATGPPQLTVTTFAAPQEGISFWSKRLSENGVGVTPTPERFGESVLSFLDPDGLKLEIIGMANPPSPQTNGGPVPAEHALCGFHGVTLSEEGYESTARLLTEFMSFHPVGSEGNRFRYQAPGGGMASTIDLLCVPDAPRGTMGTGIVHHVAFRTADGSQLTAWREGVVQQRRDASPVMDRTYFQSIYFREPGGVLFEIATDVPGFAVDEAVEELGTALKLPPQHEPLRSQIGKLLPALRVPAW